MNIKSKIPILDCLPDYGKRDLQSDLVAGLTVSVMLIPQGMAYALLAGMPPIYGLYGGLIPLFLFAIFGTSRQLSIGPVAISALLVLAGISQIAEPFSERYISLVILTGLLIGVVQILMSFLKMGFLVNFLSHPVVAGFTSAAAVIILISQLQYLLGFDIPRFDQFHETVDYAVKHISEINWVVFVICFSSVSIIILLKRINKKIPGPLLIVIAGILLVKFFNLETYGVSITGDVPKGLPSFVLPEITFENIKLVFPTVLTVTIIGIVESIGIAKMLEAKHNNYQVRPNQELFALGISKLGGALFQALPTSGSFTRSAINNDTGAKTGMSSIITAITIGLTLLFLTPLFYYLPNAILGAIVIVAVFGLIDIKEAKNLWHLHRGDFYMMLLTFFITLGLGIGEGVLAGVVLSIILMVFRNARPHVAVLGRLPKTPYFRNITRFPEAIKDDEVLIIRFDAQLYFGNAYYFKDTVLELVKEKGQSLECLILDCSSIHDMDSSGLAAFKDIIEKLKSKNVQLFLCGVIGPIRDFLHKAGLIEVIGKERQFMRIHDALEYFHNIKKGIPQSSSPEAIQTNEKQE